MVYRCFDCVAHGEVAGVPYCKTLHKFLTTDECNVIVRIGAGKYCAFTRREHEKSIVGTGNGTVAHGDSTGVHVRIGD